MLKDEKLSCTRCPEGTVIKNSHSIKSKKIMLHLVTTKEQKNKRDKIVPVLSTRLGTESARRRRDGLATPFWCKFQEEQWGLSGILSGDWWVWE